MGLRWILYGYEVVNDTYRIVPGEAAVVRKIFRNYTEGETLKAIADLLTAKGIVYYQDKRTWNKNMVSRILENEKYLGTEEYPAIIDRDTFNNALERRNVLGGKREPDSPEVKFLKDHSLCGQCGARIRRRSKYGTREKWFCSCGCNIEKYIDDSRLFDAIASVINAISANPEMLQCAKREVVFEPDADTVKKINMVKYMADQQGVQFAPMKQALFESISAKFDFLEIDKSSAYTAPVIDYISNHTSTENVTAEIMEQIIEKVIFESDGSISITFINGKTINSDGGTGDDTDITKDSDGH